MRITEPQLAAALGGWRMPGVPLAAGLAAAVRDGVLDGRLRAGSTLPAERRLAAVLGVSRGTVIAALAVLRDEGWVQTRQGSASTLRLAQGGRTLTPSGRQRRPRGRRDALLSRPVAGTARRGRRRVRP